MLPQAKKEKPSIQKACRYHKQGNCKFGPSGSNNKGHCSFPHPPLCRRLIKGICPHGITGKDCPHLHPKYRVHGPDPKYGCTKGNRCAFFHPKLCQNSLTLRMCLNLECGNHHLKGTKRMTSNKQQYGDATKTKSRHTPPPSTDHQRISPNSRNNYDKAFPPNKTNTHNKMFAQKNNNHRDNSFLLTYLENMKADLSLQIQQSVSSHLTTTLGTHTHQQPRHYSPQSTPYTNSHQCCH